MKMIDYDGFISVPDGHAVHLVMSASVLRYIETVAPQNALTAERLMLATLVGEDIDPEEPVFVFSREDDKGNTALLATQDNEPYREQLTAIIAGRQLDDPLVELRIELNSGKGN